MKGFTKKIFSTVLALTLVIGLSTSAFASSWETWFGYDLGQGQYWEAVKTNSYKDTPNSFTVNIEKIGWQGVWGGQVKKKISVVKGKSYAISFKASSSKIDKYIYVKVGSDSALAYSFWVFLPRGKAQNVTKVFKAAASSNEYLTFGIGGEFGDRNAEKDAKVRYAAFQRDFKKPATILKQKDCKPGDASSPTVISVSNFKLTNGPGKVSIKKPKALGKKKVKVSWKKMVGATKYQVQVGSVKKTTTKTSLTVKAKKKGKVAVKVRAIAGTYKAPWSKAKKVKVK